LIIFPVKGEYILAMSETLRPQESEGKLFSIERKVTALEDYINAVSLNDELDDIKWGLFQAREVSESLLPMLYETDKFTKKILTPNLASAWLAIAGYYKTVTNVTGAPHTSWEIGAYRHAWISAEDRDPLAQVARYKAAEARALRPSGLNYDSLAITQNELKEAWLIFIKQNDVEVGLRSEASLWFAYQSLRNQAYKDFRAGINTFRAFNYGNYNHWLPYFYERTIGQQMRLRKLAKTYRQDLPRGVPPGHEFSLTFRPIHDS
jgi:hypothetical protein